MLDLGYWNIGYQMLGCKLFIWFVQKLPVNNFQWIIKDTAQFNEDLKKNYNEEIDEDYFVKADVQYLQKLHELHNDLPFLTERMKIEKM